MTMLTRCAACATTFRLTTEQLSSHQGKVRCGRCGTVFNALENLFDSPLDPAADEGVSGTALPIDTATIDMFDPRDHGDTNAPASGAPDAGPEVPPLEADGEDPEVASPDAAPAAAERHPGEDEPAHAIHPADAPEESPAATARPAEAGGTPLLVGMAQEKRPGVRWVSAIGALLAGLALAGQATHHYRDQIAARVPETKPYLERACAQIGCRILPPVDGQAISIESSDLQADNANRAVLILSAVLRNRAEFAQPLPMLELSLTDALDAPVARRVLAPADYARAVPGIAAGGEVQLRVFIDATQVKANGYRLYAFYP